MSNDFKTNDDCCKIAGFLRGSTASVEKTLKFEFELQTEMEYCNVIYMCLNTSDMHEQIYPAKSSQNVLQYWIERECNMTWHFHVQL